MTTPSELRDASSWERSGDNLIELPPYSIQRLKTASGVAYLLWRSRTGSVHDMLGRFATAAIAREGAVEHSERVAS